LISEERLRANEGISDHPFADMVKLCLVPDVVIPPKFKVLDFDKYSLLSVSQLCDKGYLVSFDSQKCVIEHGHDTNIKHIEGLESIMFS